MEKLSNAKLRLFASLAAKKYRYRHRMFIVEGKKMYEEALHSGWPLEAVIVSGPLAGAFIPPPERMPPVPLWWAEDQDFRQLAQLVSPEGILTIVRFPEENFGTWTGEKPPAGPAFLLDAVQDPGNLGTIMRIADWFGFSALICSKGTVDFLNVKSLRSSMGSVFRVKIAYVDSLPDFIGTLHGPVWVADMAGEVLGEAIPGTPDYILLGNEANGVSPALSALPGLRRVHIPGSGGAESLNVSVAAGIFAWELRRR